MNNSSAESFGEIRQQVVAVRQDDKSVTVDQQAGESIEERGGLPPSSSNESIAADASKGADGENMPALPKSSETSPEIVQVVQQEQAGEVVQTSSNEAAAASPGDAAGYGNGTPPAAAGTEAPKGGPAGAVTGADGSSSSDE